MKQNTSLQTLLELAQSRTDSAARAVGVSLGKELSEEQKLHMLINYRIDYQNNFRKTMELGLSPASWTNFHEFMNKLDLAVKQQSEVVAHWRRQSLASRQEWEAKQRQLKSYDTLTQRQQLVETQRAGRIEQRNQDEYAARSYSRQRSED